MTRSLLLGLAAALLGAWALVPPAAADVKVYKGDDLRKKINKLYGDISPDDAQKREEMFVEIDGTLVNDKKNEALKTPAFWVEAIQVGRFAGKLPGRGGGKKGDKVQSSEVEVVYPDAKTGKQVPGKASFVYYAGPLYSKIKPAPLVVAVLERGADPKAWLENAWIANDDAKKEFVLAAVAESDAFPVTKDPTLVTFVFMQMRDLFNVDSNRWYLEGVGAATGPVQQAAANVLADRLAGVILRGPTAAVTTGNVKMYPTTVVYTKAVAECATAAEALKALDERNTLIEVADVASVNAANADVVNQLKTGGGRTLPSEYTWTTTLTETQGEPWTGSLLIVSPAKRGSPTRVTVKYLKDSNAIDIQPENLGEFVVYMNDDLLDLDKEVAVFVHGTQVVKQKFERDFRRMLEDADERGEYGRVFTASYRGVVPTKIEAPAAGDADKGPEGGDGEKK